MITPLSVEAYITASLNMADREIIRKKNDSSLENMLDKCCHE